MNRGLDDVDSDIQADCVRKKLLVAGCLATLVVAGYFGIYGIRTTRLETLRSLVERNVSIGSSPEAVTKFLDEEHLESIPR